MGKNKWDADGPDNALLSEFLRCRAVLKRLVARIVGPNDVDDILQETFIKACAASERTDIRHPRSFILKTARNLALNQVTGAYHRRTQTADPLSVGIQRTAESAESEFEARERFLEFCRVVRDLPAQCRRVFVLRKVYGLTQQEIAKYLQISESTVEKHVIKGLLICRQSLRLKPYESDGDGTLDEYPKKGSSHG